MVITTFKGAHYEVTDDQAGKIDAMIQAGKKYFRLNGNVIACAAVDGIFTDDQWEDMQHERRGDWKCVDEHWHDKTERFCKIRPEKAPESLALPAPAKPSTNREKWLRLIELNKNDQKRGGFGLRRELADLDLTAEQLEEKYPKGWHDRPVKAAKGTPAGWFKRTMSPKAYNGHYAGRPGYHRLPDEGSDVVVAFTMPTGAGVPDGVWACDTVEMDYLERRSGVRVERPTLSPFPMAK